MRLLKLVMPLFFGGILLSSFLLNGCSKDPLGALKSDSVDSAYSYQYWLQQYKQNTPLWHEAITYCVPNEDKPNCKDVLGLYFFGDGHEKAPKIGQSGHYIHIEG